MVLILLSVMIKYIVKKLKKCTHRSFEYHNKLKQNLQKCLIEKEKEGKKPPAEKKKI